MMDEIQFPREGDSIFAPSEEIMLNACQLRDPYFSDRNWAFYCEGFRLGAVELFRFVERTCGNGDSLVYPILSLWRHYVELRLKDMIRTVKRVHGLSPVFPTNHDLHALWRELTLHLKELGPEYDISSDAAESVIGELSSLGYDCFRYPEDKHGRPALPRELQDMNLRVLNDVMVRLANLLDGIALAIESILVGQAEAPEPYVEYP